MDVDYCFFADIKIFEIAKFVYWSINACNNSISQGLDYIKNMTLNFSKTMYPMQINVRNYP